MLHVPKTKRPGPPTEALGYSRQPARISKINIVARVNEERWNLNQTASE